MLPPDIEPRATSSMDDIIDMIRVLVDNGHAYQGSNGDVYYDVSRFESYGTLSGKNLDDLQAGARVAVNESKDDPLDFALWKVAKPDEPSWPSPWGDGRPGWHIECSAMSTRCLGSHFDIHGGGMDLKFPHHENEIAQAEAATGEHFVNYWMHNGFVRVDDEKMSKSLGNFFTVREILKSYRAEDIRYFILASHYRSPLNYSQENLENAKAALTRLYSTLRGLSPDHSSDNRCDEYTRPVTTPWMMTSIHPRPLPSCLKSRARSTSSALRIPQRQTGWPLAWLISASHLACYRTTRNTICAMQPPLQLERMAPSLQRPSKT